MNRIYLIGFMGVGKSTVGKKLAKALDYDFVDTDDLFEIKYKISIERFFTKYGEVLFREFENKILLSTFSLQNTIISTGGGTPCFYNAIDDINRNGISILLDMSVDEIVKRLMAAIKPRPLVKGKSFDELKQEIEKRLSERTIIYNKAQIIFDATNPNIDTLKDIISHIN